MERGVDVVAVSTAHGHSQGVGDTVRMLRQAFPELPIIAGNVTSAAGVEYLADCGLIAKVSTPVQLTKRSSVFVEELAFVHLGGPEDTDW